MQPTTSLTRIGALVALSFPIFATVARADRAPTSPPSAPARTPAAAPQASPRPAAPPPVVLAPIDLSATPAPCKPLAKQAVSSNLNAALAGRISLASCMADRATAPLELCDCGASIVAIDAAVAPAIALLDDVIANAEPAMQAQAEHAEGRLYAGFVARMLGTLPKASASPTEAEAAMCEMRKQTLEAQLAPWREAAMASFQHVVELVKEHPQLANNPLVVPALRDSKERLDAEKTSQRAQPPAGR